jgi:ribosomal small subunit protein bTHX
MGKGDKRTKKGKRIIGTWGVNRPKTTKTSVAPASETKKKKAPAKKKAAEKAPVAEKKAPAKKTATKKAAAKGDQLTKIEGIGPKVMEVLGESGIASFADLAKTESAKIAEILVAANSRYKMFDPTTWPEQAKMAADGKWDELKVWQDAHDGGKKK